MKNLRDNNMQLTDLTINPALLSALVPINSLLEGYQAELIKLCHKTVVFAGNTITSGNDTTEVVYLLAGDGLIISATTEPVLIKGRNLYLPLNNYLGRDHSLVAQTDCSVLKLPAEVLDNFLTWSQVAEYLILDLASRPEFADNQMWVTAILKSNLFFKIPPINVPTIFTRLSTRVVEAGEVILRQGELGNSCFFIKEGSASVTRRDDNSRQLVHLADIGVDRCFGEDALLNATTRNATVTMTSNGVLMELQKEDFIVLLKEQPVAAIDFAQVSADALLVDVRSSEEYAQGHLLSAANIPLNLLRLKQRLLRPDQPVIFYCNTGRRSRAAADLLKRQGFQAAHIAGGICWQDFAASGGWVIDDVLLNLAEHSSRQ